MQTCRAWRSGGRKNKNMISLSLWKTVTVAPSLIHHKHKCCHAFQSLCSHHQTNNLLLAQQCVQQTGDKKVTTSLWNLKLVEEEEEKKKPSGFMNRQDWTASITLLWVLRFISSSSVCGCQIMEPPRNICSGSNKALIYVFMLQLCYFWETVNL